MAIGRWSSLSRPARIKGTPAPRSFKIPRCSQHPDVRMQKDDDDKWICLKCADGWLVEYVDSKTRGASIGGVALPSGVKDDRRATPSFRDVFGNRRRRRRMRKAR